MASANPLPQQSPQTLAQSIRAKFPGTYEDMDDKTLESKTLTKYPQYGDMPHTPLGTPIQDSSTIGPPQGILQKTGQEAKTLASSAVNSKFPWVHPLDALGTAGDLAAGEVQRYAPSSVTELLLGGQAAGKPMGTSSGFANNPVTQTLASGVQVPWAAKGAAEAADAVQGAQKSGKLAQAYRTAKGAVGDFVRDPTTGALKPVTREGARAVGAATGYEAGKGSGHGMEGMLVGGYLGPEAAESMLPASGTFKETSTANELSQKMTEAETARQQQLADTEKLRNMQANSLQTRGKQQAALDPQVPSGPPKQEQDLGSFMNRGYKPVTPPPGPAPTIATKMETVADPTFSGSEGRGATWKNDDVIRLAKQGNRDAIQQKILRGFPLSDGERYIMGDPDYSRAIHNTQETTTFTPDNTPIRNVKKAPASSRARIALPWEAQP